MRVKLLHFSQFLLGDSKSFNQEKRALIAISLFSFVILIFFTAFDFLVGMQEAGLMLIGGLGVLILVYYLVRFRNKTHMAGYIFAGTSYLLIGSSYFVNSGTRGAVLYLFLLTLIMVMVILPPRQHPLWLTLHLGIGAGLIWAEYTHPEWIQVSYQTPEQRYIDIFICLSVTLLFSYITIRYLRINYFTEHRLALLRGMELESQADRIQHQNNQLEKLNREKDRLFGIIAHDLRGPLGSIRSFLEIISTGDIEERERREVEEELLKLSNNTYMLLDNLLHWSREKNGEERMILQSLNLKHSVMSAYDLIVPSAVSKNIRVELDCPAYLQVMGQREMLRIVLRNLLSNAVKFTPTGGSIQLSAQRENERVILKISDTGVGMSPQKQKEVFMNHHESSYGTNQESGVGLGLILCRDYSQAMDGKLWVESQEGVGSSFYLSLKNA